MNKNLKKLIINADDFGLCDSVNQGIIDSLKKGIVSDLSFMINLEEFQDSDNLLKKSSINEVGLHLNLTVGRTILGSKSRIADSKGNYFNLKELFLKIIKNQISSKDIYLEIKAQLKFLIDRGYNITHIDSHRNIHILPSIMKPLLQVNKELGLNVPVRMPFEKINNPFLLTKSNAVRIFLLNVMTLNCWFLTHYNWKIKTVGGNFFNNSKHENVFNEIVKQINKTSYQVFEIAVHPGYLSEKLRKYDSYYEPRLREIEFLIDKKILDDIQIQICSFGEMLNRI